MLLRYYILEECQDPLGKEVDANLSARDLFDAMIEGKDAEEIVGVHDSVLLEECRMAISEETGIDYDEIYDLWYYGKMSKSIREWVVKNKPFDYYVRIVYGNEPTQYFYTYEDAAKAAQNMIGCGPVEIYGFLRLESAPTRIGFFRRLETWEDGGIKTE